MPSEIEQLGDIAKEMYGAVNVHRNAWDASQRRGDRWSSWIVTFHCGRGRKRWPGDMGAPRCKQNGHSTDCPGHAFYGATLDAAVGAALSFAEVAYPPIEPPLGQEEETE